MQHILIRRGIAVLALAALAACDTGPTAVLPDRVEKPVDYARQVEAMGFQSEGMQEFGDNVIVEGDILISKARLREAARLRTNDPMGPRFQYHTTSLVGSPKVQQITVDLSGLNSQPSWQSAARDAITHWNAISGSYVRLTESSSGDIYVGTNCGLPSNFAALASWPSGGNPGPTIHVNPCFQATTSHAQKVHNMVHEFGHTLGLRHSNYTQMGETAGSLGAVLIPGTPTSGNASGSVMNGGTALNSWAGFATSDLTAVRYLYPLPRLANLSAGNSNGNVYLSWTAPAGAYSYDIYYVEEWWIEDYELGNSSGSKETYVGTTYEPHLATTRPWTGVWSCSYNDYWMRREDYEYTWHIRANFSNGTSVSVADANDRVC